MALCGVSIKEGRFDFQRLYDFFSSCRSKGGLSLSILERCGQMRAHEFMFVKLGSKEGGRLVTMLVYSQVGTTSARNKFASKPREQAISIDIINALKCNPP